VGEESESKIVIAPNPVDDKISISSFDEISQVNILQMNGTEVYKSDGINAGDISLDISHLPTGVYLITILHTDSQRVVRRIVKN